MGSNLLQRFSSIFGRRTGNRNRLQIKVVRALLDPRYRLTNSEILEVLCVKVGESVLELFGVEPPRYFKGKSLIPSAIPAGARAVREPQLV